MTSETTPSLVSSSLAGDNNLGAGLWCENLTYTVKNKLILRDVTFVAKPGELTCIMGPSGSGKTSLLNAMLCRLRKGKVEGRKMINGQKVTSSNVMAHAHYVMAYDVALSYLTVRETLTFTARLRMPGSGAEAQKAKVDEIIRTMELTDCADTYVGGEWRKGISKGELKRLAIAAELLGDPDILVLDEPTSGLDSYLALELVSILSKIAKSTYKTIIASIHQPSQRAFELFDSLLLLSNGGVIYHGPAASAIPYFEQTSRVCPLGYSYPDFLLEIATDLTFAGARPLQDEEKLVESVSEPTNVNQGSESSSPKREVSRAVPAYSTPYELAQLTEQFPISAEASAIHEAQVALEAMPLPDACTQKANRALGWREEFSILYLRSLYNTVRNPITNVVILFVTIVQALFLGALFFQLQEDVTKSPYPHTPISQWPIWSNVVVEYLAVGIDKEGTDPFMDILEEGVDGNGRQILFDILVNQDVVDWLMEVLHCTRNLYGSEFFEVEGREYPPWYWPPGSINGTAKALEVPADELSLASPNFEDLVSAIMGFMQVFDYVATDKATWPEFSSIYDAGLTSFWTGTVSSLSPFVSPVLCCASLEWAASTTSNIECTSMYPGVTFPEAPEIPLGDITVAKTVRSVSRLLMDFQEFSIRRKLRESMKGSVDERPPRPPINGRGHHVPRRKLGSGLGGLVTDLWSLIFDNPNTPVYAMVESLTAWKDKVADCDNSYCDAVNEVLDSLSHEISNIATSFLTILNMAGAIFFCVANLGFASYDVLLQFPKDRAVYNRETANGVHTTSPYFFAKICADLPFQLFPALMWSIIYYFMTGLDNDAGKFFQYLGICLVVSFCAYSFGYMTSALAPRLEVAVIVAPLVLVVMLVLAGFFLRDPDIPNWIEWFKHFSIYRHGYRAVACTQFPAGGTYGSLDNDMIHVIIGIGESRVWVSVLILLGWSVVYRMIAYLALKYTNRRIGLEA